MEGKMLRLTNKIAAKIDRTKYGSACLGIKYPDTADDKT